MSKDDDVIVRLRNAEVERLSHLPELVSPEPEEPLGVLLSDRIKQYYQRCKLIEPFDEEECLRPAGYDLRVGRNYSICGEQARLSDDGEIEIKPYQVVIIETLETINMPRFLIGRWNVRVKKAYQGLLWVGGAQVDPGFRGHLCCPIYNLSTQPVTLRFKDKLAMIDFVTTTPFSEGSCTPFNWKDRSMLVFEEYPLLKSGVEQQLEGFNRRIETEIQSRRTFQDSIGSRVDTFVMITFAVMAVLFTAIGIIATKGPEQLSYFHPSIWIAAVAAFTALLWFVRTRGQLASLQRKISSLQKQFEEGSRKRGTE